MRIREAKEAPFTVLLIFVFLLSGMDASNYVILSWTKEGLRELRLAYRGRLLLATSLASVRSSNSVVFTRATNGIRLVETVIRYGAIDDCIVSSSYRDVLYFSSEFAHVPPGKMVHAEADIMDVYLGVKNVTDDMSISKHSNSSAKITVNTSFITSSYNGVDNGSASLGTADAAVHKSRSRVLSAKITSAKNSSFWQMFKRNLQVMKMSKECVQFQKQAAKKLEMLLLKLDSEDGPSLAPATFNNSERDTQAPSLHHRHRHHHGEHFLRRHGTDIKDEAVQKPHGEVNKESLHSRSQPLSGSVHGAEDNFISAQNTSSNLGNHYMSALDRADTGHSSGSSISSPVSEYSTQTQTPSTDIASKHSNIVMQANRSLENSSLIHSNVDSSFPDGMSREPLADIKKAVDLALAGLSEAPAHRKKRDLLTGWMIFPGTKWCGDGDIAESKNDMGYHVELDKCCRRHDLCPLVISRLTWKYGMFNYRLHTLSHCRCDRKFRKCLKASSSPLAHLIGQIYFNVVGPQCFKFTQKSTCVQRHWWGGCRQYANNKVAFAKKQRRFK